MKNKMREVLKTFLLVGVMLFGLNACGPSPVSSSSSSITGVAVSDIVISGSGVNNNALNLTVGSSVTLKATVKPNEVEDKTVLWSSDDLTIASISSAGLLKGLKEGNTKIKASCGTFTKELVLSVQSYVPLEKITFSSEELDVEPSSRIQLQFSLLPENVTCRDLLFTVAPENQGVIVSDAGMLEINAEPQATEFVITAKGANETDITASLKVVVSYVALEKVEFVENDFHTLLTSIEVPLDEPYRVIFVRAVPEKAAITDHYFASSDESVVTVNSKGRLQFHKVGTAEITYIANKNAAFTYKIPVKVNEASGNFIGGQYYMPDKYIQAMNPIQVPSDKGWTTMADFRNGGLSAPSAKSFVPVNYKYFTGPSSWIASGGYCIELGGWDNINSGLEDDDLEGGGMDNVYLWAKVIFQADTSRLRTYFEYRATDATFKYKLRMTLIDPTTKEITHLSNWQTGEMSSDPHYAGGETYIESDLPEKFRGKEMIFILDYDDIDYPTDNIWNGVESVNIKYFTALNYSGGKMTNPMLMIGDSIMTTEFSATMTDEIASDLNYDLIRDTISGSTIAPASNIGVVDHIDSGLYSSDVDIYGSPSLIVIQRGTNDVYWSSQEGNPLHLGEETSTDKTQTYGAIKYTISYFKTLCPSAKIVWSTALYNKNNDDAKERAFNSSLKSICTSMGVNVFDLYAQSGIDATNYTNYLADGTHPNVAGRGLLKTAWENYLKNI